MSYFLYQPHVYTAGTVTTPDFMLAGAAVIGGHGVRSIALDRTGIGCATDLRRGTEVAPAIGVLIGQSGLLAIPVLVCVDTPHATPKFALFSRVALRLVPSAAEAASTLRVVDSTARDYPLSSAVHDDAMARLSVVPPQTGIVILEEPRALTGEIRMEIVSAAVTLPSFVIRCMTGGAGERSR